MSKGKLATRCIDAERALSSVDPYNLEGRVGDVGGLTATVAGLCGFLSVGDRVTLKTRAGECVSSEIVGFRDGLARAMPRGSVEGLGPGSVVLAGTGGRRATIAACDEWIGRVIDPLGQPLDGRGPLTAGAPRPVRAAPPHAASRARLGGRIDLGMRVLNAFATCRQGQRLGLFAGSGVGKSTLLAMLARHVACDVIVLALVGERGREVREFLEDDLGPDGAARSITVIATSDAPPLLRREAAYTAMAVAEHFRDQGRSVLLLMDSVTRFCLALREIGLAAGEPPATRGWPPSVFAELPQLLERAGPGPEGTGQITAIFTVLVEGDDQDEPVADAVRGILDGHVVLDRRIGESGRYPAVDVLRSLSRTVPGVLTAAEADVARRARALLGRFADLTDLVRLGAYRPGTDPQADEAIARGPDIEAWLRQQRHENATLEATFQQLAALLEGPLS